MGNLVDFAVLTSFHLAVFPVKAGFANPLLSLLSFSEMDTFVLFIPKIYIDYLLIPGSYPLSISNRILTTDCASLFT